MKQLFNIVWGLGSFLTARFYHIHLTAHSLIITWGWHEMLILTGLGVILQLIEKRLDKRRNSAIL